MAKVLTLRLCSIDGCDKTHWGLGLCRAHHARLLRHGDAQGDIPVQQRGVNGPICNVHGCDKRPHALGLCRGHHSRLKAWGDVRPDVPLAPSRVDALCIAPECSREHYGKGYCRLHLRRVQETGSVDLPPKAPPRECKVSTCVRLIRAVGYCNTHYARFLRLGSALADQPIRIRHQGTCDLDGCNRPHYCLGYCQPHYIQRIQHPRRRALEKAASGRATAEQLQARIAYYGYRCWMCGDPWTCIDHVKPLAVGGSNWPANLRPACRSCNARKQSTWPYTPTSKAS